MEHLNIMFGIMNLFTFSLIALVCFPLLNRSVKMNHYYGFRFKQSHYSDEAWYAINRHGAIRMIVWSVILMAISISYFFVPIHAGSALFWFALFAPLLLLIPALQTYRYAKSFTKNEHDDSAEYQ